MSRTTHRAFARRRATASSADDHNPPAPPPKRALDMTAWAVMVTVAALALAAGSFLAFIRYELRPRHARLDPTATGLPLENLS